MDDTPRSLPDNGDIPFMYIGRKSSFPCGNFMAVRGKTALSNNGSWRRDASKRGPQPGYISAWRIDAVLDAHYSPLVQPSTSYRTNQTIASMMPKSTSKKAPVSFSSLPLQLIGAILSAGEFDLLQVIQLLRISRRIRRAALSTPAIWQNITTTVSAASRGQVIKALAHAVKLSGGLPLSLNLKLKQGLSVNGDIPYLAWAIFETGERWESLTFEYLWTDWPGDFLSEHLFQSLEFLTAIGAEGAPGKSPFTHLSTFKVAHTGVLGHFAPRLWGISTVFPELRHLSLSTEWGEVRGTDGFVRQFAGMRRLESVHLEALVFLDVKYTLLEDILLGVPTLKNLSIVTSEGFVFKDDEINPEDPEAIRRVEEEREKASAQELSSAQVLIRAPRHVIVSDGKDLYRFCTALREEYMTFCIDEVASSDDEDSDSDDDGSDSDDDYVIVIL